MLHNNVQLLTSMHDPRLTITDQNTISAITCWNTETGKETENKYYTVDFSAGVHELKSFVCDSL